MCGNPEAVASAYSLMEYEIAADLGGPGALQSLKERAWRRGIRLAEALPPGLLRREILAELDHRLARLQSKRYGSVAAGGDVPTRATTTAESLTSG
jgi:hypothetical protein